MKKLCEDLIPSSTIPSSAESLKFEKDSIPFGVQSLTFSDRFNYPLNKDSKPKSVLTVKYLKFGFGYKREPINQGSILSSVQLLEFGNDFDGVILEGIIPSSVLPIKFGNSFNQLFIQNNIPQSVNFLKK
ncbi:hypothetical protein ACTA71_009458 [Dictyostelium dimigraforme]